MGKKYIPPFHELFEEDSAENIKENLEFLIAVFKPRWKDFRETKEYFQEHVKKNRAISQYAKKLKNHCADIWNLINRINQSYARLEPWQRDGFRKISKPEKRKVENFSHFVERRCFEESNLYFDVQKTINPTSLYTVAAAKTALERAAFLAENGTDADKIEADERIQKLQRYLTLERDVRYRYMPSLIEVEDHLVGDPMANLEFLDGLFKNSVEKVKTLNASSRYIARRGIESDFERETLQACMLENDKMFALIYAIDENMQHALLSGRTSKEYTFSHLRYDMIETECLIAEAAGKLK